MSEPIETPVTPVVPPCDHVGHHNPVVQNVLMGPQVVSVLAHNCSKCGHNFISLNVLDMPTPPEDSIVPAGKPQIIKPS